MDEAAIARGRRPAYLNIEKNRFPVVPLSPAPSPVPTQRFSRDAHPQDATSSLVDTFSAMTDSARIAVLQQMLRSSSREVLVACRDLIEPMLRHDPFKVLPVELSLRILSYIRDPQSLAAASQVSRLWYLILSDDYTWKRLCEAHHFRRLSAAGAHVPQDINGRVDTASFKNVKEMVFNPSAAQNVIPTSYRSHFKQQYLLNSAWDNGGRLAARYVLNHTEDIIATVLLMEASYFCVALNNSRIMVFGLNGRLVSCLYGHVLGVWALALKNHTLLSGGCDRDVRVWDLQTGLCTRILQGHTSTVRCLAMASPSIGISGSRDATIRIWNLDTGECLHVLEGHTGSVRRLEVTGDYLVSASYDCTAKVWRLHRRAPTHPPRPLQPDILPGSGRKHYRHRLPGYDHLDMGFGDGRVSCRPPGTSGSRGPAPAEREYPGVRRIRLCDQSVGPDEDAVRAPHRRPR